MDDVRYGFYLIPPPQFVYSLSMLHGMLRKEFGSRIAGAFMVHCTVKGFTKLREGASPADFLPALDALCARTPTFTTQVRNLLTHHHPDRSDGKATSLGLALDLTDEFRAFQRAAWGAIAPFIAPDCEFSPGDAGAFHPHLTCVQYDAPSDPALLAQEVALCRYVLDRELRGEWTARDLQLIAFTSDDWAGVWWDSLRWQQQRGWQLPYTERT